MTPEQAALLQKADDSLQAVSFIRQQAFSPSFML